MIALAHIAGLPLEEALPALAGAGASLLVARAWLELRFRDRKDGR